MLLIGKYFSTYFWFVLTATTLPFLLHANRAIFKTPKSSYWKTNQLLALRFLKTYSIERVTCWARKGKRILKQKSKSKYFQILYWHNYLETAILQSNVKYTTVCYDKIFKYTQHLFNRRRKMAVFNIYFQED